MENLVIKKTTIINTDIKTLWKVLTASEYTQKYMFNCAVKSSWKVGDLVEWSGNFKGYQAYQKGTILENNPNHKLVYTTFDPNFGLSDIPENYLTVTYEIKPLSEGTELTVTTTGFNEDIQRCEHASVGWDMVIEKLTKLF